MPDSFEDLMESARLARRDEMKRLTGLAVSTLARAANRATPIGSWILLPWRLSPEDRPGC